MKKIYIWSQIIIGKIFAIYLNILGVEVKKGLRIWGFPQIRKYKNSIIKIGENNRLFSTQTSNAIGLNHKTIIRTLENGAFIEIGDNVGISGASIISKHSIIIGNNVNIGANVVICDSDMHPIDPVFRYRKAPVQGKKIIIGNNVWIGMNTIILKGCKIGNNSVIGAASLVNKDIPENTVCAGVPSRLIRRLENGGVT